MGVEKVISLSTDKASSPVNLYGATKLTADKLVVAGNYHKGAVSTKLSVVRYGNVFGSRGSVYNVFSNFVNKEYFPITDKKMTRFNISLQDGCQMVFDAIEKSWGGELFVPKIPSYRIVDVASAIGPDCIQDEVGIRPGEKLHEEMITASDAINTYDIGEYYAILPQKTIFNRDKFIKHFNAKLVNPNFSYNSGENKEWETIESLRELIKIHVNPDFNA